MTKQPVTIAYKGYTITTDKSLMQFDDIHRWLSEESYWCKGVSSETYREAFNNSFCIGALHEGKQVAYARLITDYVVLGYLADVFVTELHRGQGISRKMMEVMMEQEWVQQLWAIRLATTDAHDLYRKFGFSGCKYPDRMMELIRTRNLQ